MGQAIFERIVNLFTNTRDSISRVSCMTRTVEWSFGVGTVGVSVTVVCVCATLLYIWNIIEGPSFSNS